VGVRFGSFAIVRFFRAAVAAFLMFRLAAVRWRLLDIGQRRRKRYAWFPMAIVLVACWPFEASRSFTLHFPDDVDLGELSIREDVNCFTCGTGEQNLGRATGTHTIKLPAARWYISLRMPKHAARLMPYLDDPSLRAIGDIYLVGSDVSDADLKHLQHIDLRSIDLSRTNITGEGLRYLRPHSKWIFVTVMDCPNLDPRYLAHFRGWKRATIRVASERDRALLAQARRIICNDEPEQICGTQIR
jgi:hypothetical protein